jgi:DNA invertase Pin-like site-specific DNA recombinase
MFYAYYRVSTETQAEKGGGLDTQRQNIEKYCADHGITLAGSFTDAGISGAVKDTDDDDAIIKRPALVEMLATLNDGDTVIVMNTSRLWRSDTAKVIIRRELMKHKVHVIAVENERFDEQEAFGHAVRIAGPSGSVPERPFRVAPLVSVRQSSHPLSERYG